MESLIHADVFFFVTTVAVIVIAIAVVAVAIYILSILRDVKKVSKLLRRGGEAALGNILDVQNAIKDQLVNVIELFGRAFLSAPKSKPKRKATKKTK